MKVAVTTSLFTKRYVKINSCHKIKQTYVHFNNEYNSISFAGMSRIIFYLILITTTCNLSFGQSSILDLQPEWLQHRDGDYVAFDQDATARTLYFIVEAGKYPGGELNIESSSPYFLFLNGKLSGEFSGGVGFSIDSLAAKHAAGKIIACIYQEQINPRELRTYISKLNVRSGDSGPPYRPASDFKDFVILSGLLIIIFFLVISQLNPKLASDYFSVIKIFSPREADDAQSNARLTSSNNFQFYVGCSMLLALYLLITLYNLPDAYALPLKFQADSFGGIVWQWIKLSTFILGLFLLKIVVVFIVTRLFNMKGLARVHFFNWVRLMLIVFGGATTIAFSYYILRGQSETIFVGFLSLIVATLIGWIFIVFMKLNGKTEHSMFHLFSYICATELIPLLITIKVLFQ